MQELIDKDRPRRSVTPSTGDHARLDEQLCFSLYAASRAATAVYRPYLEKLGLTYPRYLVLLVLWERGRLSVNDLGKHLFLDYGTLSPLLKALATDGIVTRTRDGEDERKVFIEITDKGRALEAKCREMVSVIGCKIALTSDEIDALRSQIWGLFHLLTQTGEESP